MVRSLLALSAAALVLFTPVDAPAQDATAPPAEPSFTVRRVRRADIDAARAAGTDVFAHLFGDRAGAVARFNRLDPRFAWAGRRIRVPDLPAGADYVPLPAERPDLAGDEKAILIVLDRQFLGAYERGRLASSYPISSGKEGHETPTGRFRVTRKDADHASSRYPEPDGGWPMPWALRFYRSEYWIHGGDLVGHPASHGCVRLFPADAEALFAWAGIGTRVRILASLDPPTPTPAP
jgi:hypothetical protein